MKDFLGQELAVGDRVVVMETVGDHKNPLRNTKLRQTVVSRLTPTMVVYPVPNFWTGDPMPRMARPEDCIRFPDGHQTS